MPIQDRKYYIMKHNLEQEEYKDKNKSNNGSYVTGESINAYAAIEQQNAKNLKNK